MEKLNSQQDQSLREKQEKLAIALAEAKRRGMRIETDKGERFKDDDPVRWIETHFRVPETPDHHFYLAPYQKKALYEALSKNESGKLNYSIVIWSDIKKSVKSSIAAAVALWHAWQLEWGQILIIANDLKQADSRVGFYLRRAIELNSDMKSVCKVRNYMITLPNRTSIESIPIDPSGEAGSNADRIITSELWGAHQKAQERMFTEATLSPTKFGISQRWIETYAGFSGESELLERLYEQGTKEGVPVEWANEFSPPLEAYSNKSTGMFCMWNTVPRLSWQTPEYYKSEAAILVESEFNRVHRNKWAVSQETFVPLEWWVACQLPMRNLEKNDSVILAMDAAVSGDCFALVMVGGDGKGLLEVRYARKWTPPLGGKLDFAEPEAEIRRLVSEYNIIEIAYDPYQLEDMASRLSNELIAHVYAFNQGKDRLVADKSLRDIIQSRRIAHSGEVDLKEHIQNANAEISSGEKGLRIVKKSESKKIDLAVALSMAVSRAAYWSL